MCPLQALVRTTTEEATAWAENATFYQEVLCKPWVVNDRAQLRAKKKAAGLDKEREAKKERKRRKRESTEKREGGFPKDQERSRFTERQREPHKSGCMSKPRPIEATRSYKEKKAKHPDTG